MALHEVDLLATKPLWHVTICSVLELSCAFITLHKEGKTTLFISTWTLDTPKGLDIIFLTRGDQSQMTFYVKYFLGLLSMRRENFEAYLTPHKSFLMPTLKEQN